MAKRIVIWHIPESGSALPSFYMEQDYAPRKLRIYAERAPDTDFEVDIRDDGTTILANRAVTTTTRKTVYSEIQYNTLVGTFTVGEFITGGTSSARGTVVSDARGNMTVELWQVTSFSSGETITGASSGATAVIRSFYRGGDQYTYSTGAAKTTAVLPAGANLEDDAEDFPQDAGIAEGSVLTCHEIASGGAANVTIQLELESLDEEENEDYS